ncbi:hypothetical protein N9P07_05260 [Alphaproteobacteria bacterium]|nr:hypothetical protein [Alphaproteobacteria bacterium]
MKTKKTAGTSFEIALSKFVEPAAILTRVSDEDEKVRQAVSSLGARHYHEKQRKLTASRLMNYKGFAKNYFIKGNFYNHIPAQKIVKLIGPLFFEYEKVCIHREPLDFLISMYFWGKKYRNDISFKDWVLHNRNIIHENYFIAPVEGPFKVDNIIYFDELKKETFKFDMLGNEFAEELRKNSFKSGLRPKKLPHPMIFFENHKLKKEAEEIRDEIQSKYGLNFKYPEIS